MNDNPIAYIRDEIAKYEQTAKGDRANGFDGRYADGQAAGMRRALRIMGEDA